jgi:DNA polymerase-3 subunit epsilon
MKYGLIVDVETTGLNAKQDKVIEIGLVEFQMDVNGSHSITSMYSGLEDPKEPLTPLITDLTRLTDEIVSGQKIDWSLVRKCWDRASFVIAHNAEFDRGFLQSRAELREFPKHWACSMRHIDWRSKKFGSQKLNYLAADHGFANPFAHRAMFDCATTFRLIAPHMTELIESSYEAEYEIAAIGAPFETKDALKSAGYFWDNEKRAWRIRVGPRRIDEQREFLTTQIYKGPSKHTEVMTFFNSK